MIKTTIAILFFAIFSGTVTAQSIETEISYQVAAPGEGNNVIGYTPKQKLVIADFKGSPDEASNAVAITSSGFLFNAGFRSKDGKATMLLTVECSFNRQKSWMKERGKNAYILEHEQHHFDITYIGAMQFMEKLKKTKFTTGNYKEQLQTIYQKAVEEMQQQQIQYDTETGNGTNKEKQAWWNDKINEQLK